MGSWDFILESIRFSYSAISSFDTCAYGYKMNYIDALPKENNFYGEYGSFIHECFEAFFRGEVKGKDLSSYYSRNYKSKIKLFAPPSPWHLDERYKLAGQEFFDNFKFDLDSYDVLGVEETIDFDLNGSTFTARPDLILRNKESGLTSLYDYKTSTPIKENKKTGKEVTDHKKMEGYYKQMYIYAHALKNHGDIPVDDIVLWFPRMDRQIKVDWDEEKEIKALQWADNTIHRIKDEELFLPDNSAKYFCDYLCGCRQHCEYRK